MHKLERLAEIKSDLKRNKDHKKIMLFLIIALGFSTAMELYEGTYWAVIFDFITAILVSIDITLTHKEDLELINEQQILQNDVERA